ncbi:MAG: cation:proton antiporter, partial [Candidatus Eremiobacteraeota bacterium]|nr:cation:proton antiporter [Candidatus Eremiobacteraeota bacterium]
DLDAAALRRAARAIAVLAVPGVAFTALAIAAGGVLGGLVVPAALVLGAVLCATDPVAVLALFRKLDVPVDLLTIVEGESIANDGVAVVLLQVVMSATGGAARTPVMLWPILGHAAYSSVAGIVVGIAFATLARPLLRRGQRSLVGIVTTLFVAYGAYAAASFLGASGIFASASAGVALPALSLERSEQLAVDRFWERTALIANGLVFLLLGLSLQLDRVFHEPLLLAATAGAVVLSRAVLAYIFVPFAGVRVTGRGWRHAIALAGVRGGLSLALVLGLPQEFPDRPAIIDAVFAVVFGTIVLQGWTLAPVLRRIGLRAPAPP